jgi:hypothetical protein
MNPYLAAALQIAVGIVIVIVIFYLSLYILQQDNLVQNKQSGVKSPNFDFKIINGYIDSNFIAKKRYSTRNPMDNTFVPIPRAYNRMGGAQFSYSFWLFVGDSHQSAVQGKAILLKGSPEEYRYAKTTKSGDSIDTEMSQIKCPKIRFGESFKDIVIEFNTQDDITHVVNLTSTEHATDTTLRHNLLDLMQNKWVFMAITMEDNIPINDFENGIVVRFYLNDILYYTHRVASTLRQNNGDLYLFPDGDVRSCRIADLKYYNYALGFQNVKGSYTGGPAKFRADADETIGHPLHITEYNKIDLYNR